MERKLKNDNTDCLLQSIYGCLYSRLHGRNLVDFIIDSMVDFIIEFMADYIVDIMVHYMVHYMVVYIKSTHTHNNKLNGRIYMDLEYMGTSPYTRLSRVGNLDNIIISIGRRQIQFRRWCALAGRALSAVDNIVI